MTPVTKSIIVDADVSDVYGLWSHFEMFPYFMENIKEVTITGPNTSHWVMKGLLGKDFQWEAQTTALECNSRIAWRSIRGDLMTEGDVRFEDQGGGRTRITATVWYDPPAGLAGEIIAKLFTNPDKRLESDLERFKEYAKHPQATLDRGCSWRGKDQ